MLFHSFLSVVSLSLFLWIEIQICECLNTKPQVKVVVAGATGYIGRTVVKELVSRGIPTASLVRSLDNIPPLTQTYLAGSEMLLCDVLDPVALDATFDQFKPTVAVCCLASRSGVAREAWTVDYKGGYNILEALSKSTSSSSTTTSSSSTSSAESSTGHYVLLSAFCVGKPLLQFQYAKIKLEDSIRSFSSSSSSASSLSTSLASSNHDNTPRITHSIVRPTAFFKSLDGQVETVRKGNPILYFGPGTCSANAISDEDLACFMADCALNPTQINMLDQTRNIGGPDVPPITKLQQGHLIYDTLNIPQNKRKFISIPYSILDGLTNVFAALERIFATLSGSRSSLSSLPSYSTTASFSHNLSPSAHSTTLLNDSSSSDFNKINDNSKSNQQTDSSNTGNSNSNTNRSNNNNWFESQRIRFEDAAEIVRIIKYYASEPMVAIGQDEIQGTTTLKDHFQRIANNQGQLTEVDKMTTTTGILESFAKNDYVK